MKNTYPKPSLLLAIGAGLMTFGMLYNYQNGNYAWALLQGKLLIGYFIVLYLKNKVLKRKYNT